MRNALALLAIAVSCGGKSTGSRTTNPNEPNTGFGTVAPHLAYEMRAGYTRQVHSDQSKKLVQLTATDGSELELTSLAANIKFDGPLARTELRMMFMNRETRVREGRFRIELPPGAAIGRFAMRVGTELREARVVSREKGREVYEGFLHQRVDPALLEQDAGNQFSARVFPIEAQTEKEIVIGYDHAISHEYPYQLPLRGLRMPVKITVERDGVRSEEVAAEGTNFTHYPMPGDAAIAANGTFVARVRMPDFGALGMSLDRTLFLVDTSASRAPVMGKQFQALSNLMSNFAMNDRIAVAAFDHDVAEIARGDHYVALWGLYDRGALGASDLGRALDYAAASGMKRVVLIGDGVPTLGETNAAKLAEKISGSKIERFDVLQVSDTIDRDLLGALVRAGKQPGAIVDGRNPARARDQLGRAVLPEVPISVVGATEVWPRTTRGIAPGDPILIAGRAPVTSQLAIRIGTYRVTIAPERGDATQVGRTVARQELATLADRIADAKDARDRSTLEARVEKVALEHSLISTRTSFLVLETDADEARTLGPRPGDQTAVRTPTPRPDGETIRVRDTAPTIDPTSTTQGVTIDREYLRNIPVPGRTFESALGQAGGSQGDGVGISFSGSSSLENQYYVDGIDTTGLVFGKGTQRNGGSPYTGTLANVMFALARNERPHALTLAVRARLADPGDVAALIALGEALEASGANDLAARAYGSLIDLFPNRDDLARAAGQRLDRVGARELAIDAYRRALRERPDRATTYRQLAYALLRGGRASEALDVVLEGKKHATGSIAEVLAQDARVIAAAIVARDPARASSLRPRVGEIAHVPSMQIVLSWETDANDVDLHVRDRHGKTAFFSTPVLKSGGKLLADVTTGFGPEMFLVENPNAFPYSVGVHYYSRGPMGLGIGTVQVIRHDGAGKVTVEDRPFVLQKDGATIELGAVR